MATYASTTIVRSVPATGTVAFPAAAANVASVGYDLASNATGRAVATLAMQLAWPALATHNNASQVITATLEESTDNANWSNVNPLIQGQIVGVSPNGAVANNLRLPFPSHLGRYARAVIAVPAAGPNVTNKNITVSIVVA